RASSCARTTTRRARSVKRSNMVLPRPVVVMDRDYADPRTMHPLFAAGVTAVRQGHEPLPPPDSASAAPGPRSTGRHGRRRSRDTLGGLPPGAAHGGAARVRGECRAANGETWQAWP